MPARSKRSESARKRWGRNKRGSPTLRPNRPARLRQWSDEAMMQALEAVRSGRMGTNQAARDHGVPCTTLKDRVAGRVKHGCKFGPKPYD